MNERLAQPSEPQPASEPFEQQIGRRGAPRLRLSIPAKLVSRYGTHRCILIDLSCTGAQLGLEEPLDLRETAFLQIGGIEPFCEVVRCVHHKKGPNDKKQGGINGLRFDPEIPGSDVLKVRAYAETYQMTELRALRSEVRDWCDGLVRR